MNGFVLYCIALVTVHSVDSIHNRDKPRCQALTRHSLDLGCRCVCFFLASSSANTSSLRCSCPHAIYSGRTSGFCSVETRDDESSPLISRLTRVSIFLKLSKQSKHQTSEHDIKEHKIELSEKIMQ